MDIEEIEKKHGLCFWHAVEDAEGFMCWISDAELRASTEPLFVFECVVKRINPLDCMPVTDEQKKAFLKDYFLKLK